MALVWNLLSTSSASLDELARIAAPDDDEDSDWYNRARFNALANAADSYVLGEEWHTLYYFLNCVRSDAPSPLGHVLLGRTPLGPVRLGQGDEDIFPRYEDDALEQLEIIPAGVLSPYETREVARELEATDISVVAARFDVATLQAARIFPWAQVSTEMQRLSKASKHAPAHWWDVIEGKSVVEHDWPFFFATRLEELRRFYARAAEGSRGVFQYPMGVL